MISCSYEFVSFKDRNTTKLVTYLALVGPLALSQLTNRLLERATHISHGLLHHRMDLALLLQPYTELLQMLMQLDVSKLDSGFLVCLTTASHFFLPFRLFMLSGFFLPLRGCLLCLMGLSITPQLFLLLSLPVFTFAFLLRGLARPLGIFSGLLFRFLLCFALCLFSSGFLLLTT